MRIDLSGRKAESENISSDDSVSWIGGRGLNVRAMMDESRAGLDPFHPDTLFCLAVGPLTGSLAPGAAITSVASRSPLLEPHTYVSTSMGGHWGAELKFAGYDQIIIAGEAVVPTYIWIDNDKVNFKDATHLWGKDTSKTTVSIQEELNDRGIQVLCIGPAGERLVRYASLVNSFLWDSGRLGLGSVLGSKKVKAIAVRGTQSVGVAEPDRLATICQHLRTKMHRDDRTRRLSDEGTLFMLSDTDRKPSNNQNEAKTIFKKSINSEQYHKDYFFSKEGCFSCPIHCGRYTYIRNGRFSGTHFGGVHGESVLALGPEIGNCQWDSILKMIQLCLLYGLDPVSTGGTIAWAMNSFDHGLLIEQEADGIALHVGNADGAMELVTKIAERSGFGNVLAEGAFRASRTIGRGTERFVPHIKGLELIGLGSLSLRTILSLAVMTGDWDYFKNWTGADKGEKAEPAINDLSKTNGIPELVKYTENVKCATDLLGVCSFPYSRLAALSPSDLAEQFCAITGTDFDSERLLTTSEKIIEMERILSVRDGTSRSDEIPYFVDGESEYAPYGLHINREEWETLLSRYYALRKWDKETGHPNSEKPENCN